MAFGDEYARFEDRRGTIPAIQSKGSKCLRLINVGLSINDLLTSSPSGGVGNSRSKAGDGLALRLHCTVS